MRVIRAHWDKLFLVAGVLLILLPLNPAHLIWPSPDSGVFLYSGWRFLHGEIPYRDFWDQKPPLVYLVDAAGLAFSGGSRWGVWAIELSLLFLAASTCFKLLKRTFGVWSASLAIWIVLLALPAVLQGGNLTEEYALAPQFAALWLIGRDSETGVAGWRGFFLGLLGAIAFFFKQTTIGVWIAFVLYLSIRRLNSRQVKAWLLEMLSLLGGALTVTVPIVAFFAAKDALADFWSAAFIFNIVYSSGDISLGARLVQGLFGFTDLGVSGLWPLALLGAVLGLASILPGKPSGPLRLPLMSIALIDLPIEIVFISLSGRQNPHYYISAIPGMSVLAAAALSAAFSRIAAWHLPTKITLSAGAVVCLWLLWTSYVVARGQVASLGGVIAEYPATALYVESNTTPDDTVLVWGNEASINFMTMRKSPTRFVYLFPLYERDYGTKDLVTDFLDSLVLDPPRLIVDTANSATPFMWFRNSVHRSNRDLDWLKAHYVEAQVIGRWSVYRYVAGGSPP